MSLKGTIELELLTEELRRQLPPIRKNRYLSDEDSRMIYARFLTANSEVVFYVAEGEQRESDYLFWGLLIVPQFRFPSRFQVMRSQLESADWLGQEPCQRDESFQPTIWRIIEPTILYSQRSVQSTPPKPRFQR
jgi:hypothetical protein